MGCVPSKHAAKEIKNRNYSTHVVSLTSSTYGVLNLEKEAQTPDSKQPKSRELRKTSPFREAPPEIIDARELMEGLEEEVGSVLAQRKSPKSRPFLRTLSELDARSPLRILNQMGSPRKMKKSGGKENKGSTENSPKGSLKENSVKKPSPRLWASIKGSHRCDSLRIDSGVVLSRKKNLFPFFDPDLVAAFEKEVTEEEAEIKKMVSIQSSRRSDANMNTILESYEKKCPPGGENVVVVYTTTLRGIRKTFEECNLARSIIESHDVRMFERDISMDSGFKEELRGLMGKKEVKVPVVFVKGRFIGGVDEVVRLDEEGRLGVLLSGIQKASPGGCRGCAGIRFVMCSECSGSCKLMGDDGKKSLKCGECNENGLVHCPICC